ncbi:MAG: aldo/keto reductase [Flavobacteriaceae bacterium]|nr:MAG: aldo/keto reductase [Flavobacteriaceae bacterium]
MIYSNLPGTQVKVSKICLGTMNFGEQNTIQQAHRQLDVALEMGVNFIDTAELYAIPIKAETQGSTERFIGEWLKNQDRDKIVLASKAAGPMPILTHIRNVPNFSKNHLIEAVEGSLKRLHTDYIDLYQLHWPERATNFFGTLGYTHKSDETGTPFKEVLETLQSLVEQGKIRHIGLSNETPWGLMQFLWHAQKYNLPKVVSIQNPYSLVNRTFEVGLSEMSIREEVGCLPYSPLAGGLLSGKYLSGKKPEGARYTLYPNYFSRYSHPNTTLAVEAYGDLAQKHNLSLAQMSLAYVNSRDFVTSNIIGATTEQQLRENILSSQIVLSEEVLAGIEEIHLKYPNPAP